MAVTVTDDVVVFDAADAIGNWSVTNFSSPVLDPDAAVQGTNCVEARGIDGGGIGTITANRASVNVAELHFYGWVRQSWIWATVGNANPGVQVRVSSSANGQTNFVDFATAGQDRGVTSFKGWVNVCQDIKEVDHSNNGTIPELANSGNGYATLPTAGYELNFVTGNNKTAALCDELKFASTLTIGGGTTADPGQFDEISTNDETNGDGFVKLVGGVFFVNIGLMFGNTASASSEFSDDVKTIIFEDWTVAYEHYVMHHRGNATGTNNFQLGTLNGTGVDETGSNGCIIQSAGAVPWHIHCDDANTDKVGYYGCTFLGPPTFSIYGGSHREVFVEDNSASSFVYERADVNFPGAPTTAIFTNAPALNDAIYFGNGMPWNTQLFDVAVVRVGTYTITWEYWNGSSWTALPRLKDGTNNFETSSFNFITWEFPDDWAATAVNSRTQYYIRARISAFTSSTTAPTINSSYPYAYTQNVFKTASFEMITGTMIGMGPVVVRNGANLKKVNITGSVGPYAVDLGSTDPTANTVRDLNISFCKRGLFLRGTSTGTTSYNLRNITFSENGGGVSTIVEDNSLGSFVVDQVGPNNETPNDTDVFPATAALNDAFYISHDVDTAGFEINVGTAGVGTYSVTWEYWNGSAWTALSGVTDGTNGFTTAGVNTVTFTRPTNWTWVGLANGFYGLMTRARISSFTSMTTNPLITRLKHAAADIRIDFPAAATVNINILEGGTTPTIDNVNGCTVNVNNTVTVKVTVLDTAGSPIQNARVLLEADTGGPLAAGTDILTGLTDVNGVVQTSSFNFTSNQPVTGRSRKSTTSPFYKTASILGTITANGFDATIQMISDE